MKFEQEISQIAHLSRELFGLEFPLERTSFHYENRDRYRLAAYVSHNLSAIAEREHRALSRKKDLPAPLRKRACERRDRYTSRAGYYYGPLFSECSVNHSVFIFESSSSQDVAILAHEMGHVLMYDNLPMSFIGKISSKCRHKLLKLRLLEKEARDMLSEEELETTLSVCDSAYTLRGASTALSESIRQFRDLAVSSTNIEEYQRAIDIANKLEVLFENRFGFKHALTDHMSGLDNSIPKDISEGWAIYFELSILEHMGLERPELLNALNQVPRAYETLQHEDWGKKYWRGYNLFKGKSVGEALQMAKIKI